MIVAFLFSIRRGKKDGLSKEGSGRVALYRATGLVRSYTLECNYNTGRFCNVLPPLAGEPDTPASTPLVFEPVPYTPAHYEQVGRADCVGWGDARWGM